MSGLIGPDLIFLMELPADLERLAYRYCGNN